MDFTHLDQLSLLSLWSFNLAGLIIQTWSVLREGLGTCHTIHWRSIHKALTSQCITHECMTSKDIQGRFRRLYLKCQSELQDWESLQVQSKADFFSSSWELPLLSESCIECCIEAWTRRKGNKKMMEMDEFICGWLSIPRYPSWLY